MLDLKEPKIQNIQKLSKIKNILNGLILTDDIIESIKNVFINEMDAALNMQPSSLQMENTYIPELIDGTENGIYLAMDLGGTNLRIIKLQLNSGEIVQERVQHFPLPDNLRVGCGTKLFDYLAYCLDIFAQEHQLHDNTRYPLGFTFSFPMRQHSLDSGELITWTKSFDCPSVVGQDAANLLRKCLHKCGRHNIDIVAILNDTTGTLMHGALLDKRTRVGIVLGTGSNGCYMEYIDRVKRWEQKAIPGKRHIIIDIEWGAFGDNGVLDFIRTNFDYILDATSLLKHSFTFEKYIGGKYLGELCRIILQCLHQEDCFLPNLPAIQFPKPWTFDTNNVSRVELDTVDCVSQHSLEVLKTYFQCHTRNDYTDDDIEVLRYVCGLISKRAAQLVAINTSVLLNRMDDVQDDIEEGTVAIDGSLYKHHIRLRQWLIHYTEVWASSKKVNFLLAEDGSGKGAALIAAIADKLHLAVETN